MEIVLFWVGLAVVVAIIAGSRGRSGFGWFLLSLVFSPVLTLILVLALPAIRAPETPSAAPARPGGAPPGMVAMKKCPDCAEMVRAEARICRHCRHEFPEESAGPLQKTCPNCGRKHHRHTTICPCGMTMKSI